MPTYDYIIAMDFEATCWDDNIPITERKCEIIEFPAVLFNLRTGRVVAEFHKYLKPTERPVLSAYCLNLTGISQQTVNSGITLNVALELFQDWFSEMQQLHNLVLPKTTKENLAGNVVFVTWSNFDLGTFLHNECRRKNLQKPSYFNRWIDVGEIYSQSYKTRARRFCDALKRAGIRVRGRLHSGIDDARNLAALTYKLVKRGTTLRITRDMGGGSSF